MAEVQKYFEEFHDKIRIDYEMSEPLREKREKILKRIRKYLKDKGLPSFKEFHQGSYAMKTGVAPVGKLEYDIDVGLRFYFTESDYTAEQVRKWIFDATDGHTEKVKDKGPCTRVTYADGYHVDLVSYAVWEEVTGGDQYRLAHKTKGWRPAAPMSLIEFINKAMEPFEDTEDNATKTNQFRRVVRYLRRWIDEAIPRETATKPSGLAFVLLATNYLHPRKTWDGKLNDMKALYEMVTTLSGVIGRIVVNKPTPEYEDLFGKLSDEDIEELKDKFQELKEALEKATDEPDPTEACKILQEQFGDDFHVPPSDDTAKKTETPALITTGSSA